MSQLKNNRRMGAKRAFTIVESMIVLSILALISGFVVGVIVPTMAAPAQAQAKGDTIAAAAQALYRLQRDVRQANRSGVYVCTFPAPSTCNVPTQSLQSVQVLAVLTARTNGNGQTKWDASTGQPVWQGVQIYWLQTDGQGSNNLMYAFSASTLGPGPPTTNLNATVSAAVASGQTVAASVSDFQTFVNPTTDTVGVKLIARATDNGRTNETSFESDTLARN